MSPDPQKAPEPFGAPGSALEYRCRYARTTMIMAQLNGAIATREELCRVVSVDTISPGLWVTVRFLDGKTRSLRPDMIRAASEGERALEKAAG